MAHFTATVAEMPTLDKYSAKIEKIGSLTIMNYKLWKFQTNHDKILDSNQMKKLAHRITLSLRSPDELVATVDDDIDDNDEDDHIYVNDFKLRLPAMIFAQNSFILSYYPVNSTTDEENIPESLHLSFEAKDAIKSWAKRHTKQYLTTTPWTAIQVPMADSWKALNTSDIAKEENKIVMADVLAWDWTFTTEYCGTITYEQLVSKSSDQSHSHSTILSTRNLLFHTNSSTSTSSNSNGDNNQPKTKIQLESITSSGLNMAMLRDTTQPILLYDEAILYQDDLEDCGEVSLQVKFRVMPDFWLLLQRFFLRVDGSLILIRESRYFHMFGDDNIYIDVLFQELSLRSLPSSSSSSSINNSEPEDINTLMLRDRIKNDPKLQRDGNTLSKLLPIVNEKENIPRYYRMKL